MIVKLKGIKRNSPGDLAENGELDEMIGVRFKNGTFRPTPEYEAVLNNVGYERVFIHSNSGYKHLLGVKTIAETFTDYDYLGAFITTTTYYINQVVFSNSNYYKLSSASSTYTPPPYGGWVSLGTDVLINGGVITVHVPGSTNLYYFAKDANGVIESIPEVSVCSISGDVTFTQIGNVININDSNGLKYAIWYDDSYKVIDSNFDGSQTDTSLIGKVDLKVDSDLSSGTRSVLVQLASDPDKIEYSSEQNMSDAINDIKSKMEGLYLKGLSNNKSKGNLSGFIFACTALELYDGSYIMHSNPVLLSQAYDINMRYSDLKIGTKNHDYLNNKAIFSYYSFGQNVDHDTVNETYYGGLQYVRAFAKNSTDKYFVQTPIYPCWGECERAIYKLPLIAEYYRRSFYVFISSNKLKYKINSSISQYLKPLIKSISVFITNEVDMYESSEFDYIGNALIEKDSTFDLKKENYIPKIKTNDKIIQELSELKTFYKVKTIDFDDIKVTTANEGWVDVDLSNGILENLTAQEPLPYDNFSHHQLLPEIQFVYNSKLHIGNCSTLFSRGFPLGNFYPNQGIGQFQPQSATISSLVSSRLNFIEVSIKTLSGTTKVVRYSTASSYGSSLFTDLMPMVSYPDSRAFKMVIYKHVSVGTIQHGGGGITYYWQKAELELKPFEGQNFAYYISPDLKPIQFHTISQSSTPEYSSAPSEVQRSIISSNVARVSEINNPFTFPVENTYAIGNGRLLGFATNTIALSTGQAGDHPLYVLHTQGIDALFIGGADINYASSRPISREVCNNPKSITPIDNGVVFTTEKGLMMISGSTVTEIGDILEGNHFDLTKLEMFYNSIQNDGIVQLSNEKTNELFLDYISEAIIGYNYPDKELWITNPNKTYSYVLSNGIWFKVKTTGNSFVSDYPKQYLLKNESLYDLSSEGAGSKEIMLLTRPMLAGDTKKIVEVRAIVRGKFELMDIFEGETLIKHRYLGLYVYGSYDGESWLLLGGNTKIKSFKDIGVQIKRTNVKYIRIGLIGNLKSNSEIDYIEIELK